MPSGNKYKITQAGIITYIGTGEGNNDDIVTEQEAWTKLPEVSKTGGFDSSKGVNAPKLGTELTAVTLTSDMNDYTTNGTWYNYVAQAENTDGKTSKWANAVTTDTDGSITGYYVWIPRYAYKITKGYHGIGLTDGETAGTIEVKFLKNATNEFADGTGTAETDPSKITYTDGVQNEWLVHPAFLSDASIGGGFGSSSESSDGITGLWVAKFEISAYIDASDTSTRTISQITAEQQIKLRVLPGVESSCIKDIGTMYDYAYNMNRASDSHMLKNSEWGAVVYLSHSAYGRNGVGITANSQTYAGQGENQTDTFTGGSNTEEGYLSNGIQSTTGNAYGIYDMNGGKSEYVAAYAVNSDGTVKKYGETLFNTTDVKYKNQYGEKVPPYGYYGWYSYDSQDSRKGNAIYEISTTGNTPSYSSWFGGCSRYPTDNSPFFSRGSGGEFGFCDARGEVGSSYAFRSCLVIE